MQRKCSFMQGREAKCEAGAFVQLGTEKRCVSNPVEVLPRAIFILLMGQQASSSSCCL